MIKTRQVILIIIFISLLFSLFITDSFATTFWAKTYSRNTFAVAKSIQQTLDDGFIVAGITSDSYGYSDWLLIKLDLMGNIQWQKTYGGDNGDYAESILRTIDGYIVAGWTWSFGSYFSDFWIIKLDLKGDIQWQRKYELNVTGNEAHAINQTSDGGYIVAGSNHEVLKLDSNGNIQWQKKYEPARVSGFAQAVQQTSDGGYIVAGYYGGVGCFILKLDSNGNIQWQKTYGSHYEQAESIQQTLDGGYIVAAQSESFISGKDYWIFKLDSNGNIQWQKSYGGGDNYKNDYVHSIQQTSDGGYIVGGMSESFNAGYLVLKLDLNGNVQWEKIYDIPFIAYTTGSSIQETLDGGYIVAPTSNDIWVLKLDSNGNIGTSCEIIGTSNVIITDTNVIPVDTFIDPIDTDASVSDTSAIPVDTNTTVTEWCLSSQYNLTITIDPQDSGTVTGDGINCPDDCEETYAQDTEVILTAIPNDGWKFECWDDGVTCDNQNPINVVMDENKELTAKLLSSQLTFIRPMDDWNQNGYMFEDNWPFNRCGKLLYKHVGIDVNVGRKYIWRNVKASAGGVVKGICYSKRWKYALVIEHDIDGNLDTLDDKVSTVYWHINSTLPIELPRKEGCYSVVPEVPVGQGEKIAKVANIGRSSHLHFGIRWSPFDQNLSAKGALPPVDCKDLPAFPEAFVNPLDFLE